MKTCFKSEVLKKNKYSLIAALCTAVIILGVYLANVVYPIGINSVLCVDLYHQYAPLYSELWDRLMEGGSFLYSWNSGGGMAWLGNFFNYLSSPFSFLVCLFPKENILEAIALIILLKCSFASFTFSAFIKTKTENKSYFISAFGVLYSCSGWFMAYYWDLMWLDAFYLLPLVAYSIEKLIDSKRSALYIITLALTFITNYYMAYMVCIFAVVYFIYYYFSNYDFKNSFSKSAKLTEIKDNHFINRGFNFAFSSVGGVLLSAFAILPVFFILRSSSATGDKFPDEFITSFNIFDFIVQHFTAIEPTVHYVGEDVYLPNVSCGVLSLMLLPLFYLIKSISKKEKFFSTALLVFIAAGFYINYIDFVWNGFHFPNDLPFRYSYMYSFVLLIIAFKTLEHIKEVPVKYIKYTAAAFIVFLLLAQKMESKNFDEMAFWVNLAFVIIYYFILLLLNNEKYPQRTAILLALLLVCTEYTIGNSKKYMIDTPREDYTYDYASLKEIQDVLDENEGNDYYRMELLKVRPQMSPSWYGYKGVNFFTSMANENNAIMNSLLGMKSNGINSAVYYGQTPVYDAFFGIKYVLESSLDYRYELPKTYYERLNINSIDFYTHKNLYPLDLGFAVDEKMIDCNFNSINPFKNQAMLFESATGVKNVFNYAKIVSVETENLKTDKRTLAKGELTEISTVLPAESTLTIELKAKQAGDFYACVCAENLERHIEYTVGEQNISHNIVYGNQIVYVGSVDKGEKITVKITIPYVEDEDLPEDEIFVTGAVVDHDAFEKGYNKLKKSQFEITTFEEDYFSGTINMPENSVLYTSVPYDKGWSVMVDGEKANDKIVVIADNLMGVYLDEGEHTVEFTYSAPGLKDGIIISSATAIILALAFVLKRKKRKYKESEN